MTRVPGPVAIEAAAVERRVAELAAEIDHDHPAGVVLLGVVPEAGRFAEALRQRLTGAVTVEPITVTRFGSGEARARLVRAGRGRLAGRAVLVVTTIVDTGLRLRFAATALAAEQPASIGICALLDRPDRRIVDLPIDHVGFTVPDCLFAGYGLGGPGLAELAAVHYRDAASAERARRSHLLIA